MYKIRKAEFKGHPILGDLTLDFCGQDGKAVDTIIFAGENGTGKSTILNELYGMVSDSIVQDGTNNIGTISDIILELEVGSNVLTLEYKAERTAQNSYRTSYKDTNGNSTSSKKLNLVGLYSDPDINLKSYNSIGAVTSLDIDTNGGSRRSSQNLPEQINQLIVDLQNMDDSSLARAMRENPKMTLEQLSVEERMPRFRAAFEKIFDDLQYDRIENHNNHKEILFKKKGVEVPIDKLSSGEKQIIYRGSFMLRDVNALRGAAVFIDEPEMNLHPGWQIKIMDYYKSIFSDMSGNQTSQMFVATHSPFIIHNDNRHDDKVIVLTRGDDGNISTMDKPEYYSWDSVKVVEDAFKIMDFQVGTETVYLEGSTDVMYFSKATDIYEYGKIPFKFMCLENSNGKGGGKSGLNSLSTHLANQNLKSKVVFLYDCDTDKNESSHDNIYVRHMPKYDNAHNIKKGIENALVINDEIDIRAYYKNYPKTGDYGEEYQKPELDKMGFCKAVCALDKEVLKKIFSNLKTEIDKLIAIFNEDG